MRTPSSKDLHPAYRRDIDGLRALAVLSVVAYHASPALLTGGFVGVDVFFVISGYLISQSIFKSLDAENFSFANFYARRVRRIFPALIIVLLSSWIAGWFLLTGSEYILLGKHIAAGGGFVSNIVLWLESGYFDVGSKLKPLLHLWSLGIEEQYYIFWPIIAFVFWKRLFGAMVFTLFAISLAVGIFSVGSHSVAAFYLPAGRIWELLAGSLLAYWTMTKKSSLRERLRVPLGNGALNDLKAMFGLLLLAGSVAGFNEDMPFPGWLALLPVGATCLFIWAGESAWVNRHVLGNPLLVFVGLISYPLYLWHWPLLTFARILQGAEPPLPVRFCLVVLSVVLAILTYLYVEKPVRRGKWPGVMSVTVLSLCLVAVSGLGYVSYLRVIVPPRLQLGLAIADANQPARPYTVSSCEGVIAEDAPGGANCRIWGDPKLQDSFVVWGDSHAHAWLAVIADIAEAKGAKLVEFAYAGCPPVLGVRRTTVGGNADACNSFGLSAGVMDAIRKIKPKTTFLVARWSLYTRGLYVNGELVERSFVTSGPSGDATPETSKASLAIGLRSTFEALSEFGDVVVFRTIPILNSPIESGAIRDPDGFEPTMAEHRAYQAIPDQLIDAAARGLPSVKIFDAANVICDAKCHAIVNGLPIYSDDNHVTERATLLFKNAILQSMQ